MEKRARLESEREERPMDIILGSTGKNDCNHKLLAHNGIPHIDCIYCWLEGHANLLSDFIQHYLVPIFVNKHVYVVMNS